MWRRCVRKGKTDFLTGVGIFWLGEWLMESRENIKSQITPGEYEEGLFKFEWSRVIPFVSYKDHSHWLIN